MKEEENKIKALNRSLEQREINKLIKSMDRSRSSRNYQNFEPYSKPKKNKDENKLIISVQQQEGTKGKNKKNDKKSKSPSRSKSRKSTAKSAGKSPQKKSQPKKKK